MRDAEAHGHVIGGPMIAGHGCRSCPGEVVVKYLSQRSVVGESDVCKSLVKASNCPAIHFVVRAVAAMHPDDSRLIAIRLGIRAGTAERLSPVSSKPLHMLRMEAVAESMAHHLVGHDAAVPGPGKTT